VVSSVSPAKKFNRSQLSRLWVTSADTKIACSPEKSRSRYKLSNDGKTLLIKLDRKSKLNSGKIVSQFSASVVRSSRRSLFITYNLDAGKFPADYPKMWEMVFVTPGVFRWRASNWPKGQVNPVVGIRCSK